MSAPTAAAAPSFAARPPFSYTSELAITACLQPFTVWDEEELKRQYMTVLEEIHEVMMKELEADEAEKKEIQKKLKFQNLLRNAYILAMNYRKNSEEGRKSTRIMKGRSPRTKELYEKIQKHEITESEENEYDELVEDEDHRYYIDEDNGKYILMDWMWQQIDSAGGCNCGYFADAMDVLENM